MKFGLFDGGERLQRVRNGPDSWQAELRLALTARLAPQQAGRS